MAFRRDLFSVRRFQNTFRQTGLCSSVEAVLPKQPSPVIKIIALAHALVSDRKGVNALEYGTLGVLVVVACVKAINALSTTVLGLYIAIAAAP